eukprot:TRINITY_DN5899_c0_g1_i1.p1 TRINITY_DN5899_c0_g1~~TRINITY_DN5899_c0_g1_i1.p1  ORF type:complete len:134 (-),score=47.56 TRINITY_DN5899_c0_g1_i1:241-615(-)
MAADRGAFVDQSQSFNVHMPGLNYAKMSSMHFYAWKKGLKTGMYYLRSRAAVNAIQFTVDQAALKKSSTNEQPTTPSKVQQIDSSNSSESTPLSKPAKLKTTEDNMNDMICSLYNRDACESCSG